MSGFQKDPKTGRPQIVQAVKPGTRCECRDEKECNGHLQWISTDPQCREDATRTVTVQDNMLALPGRVLSSMPVSLVRIVRVPMCEPCAAWYEAKASARS